jgi:hypothetical protein
MECTPAKASSSSSSAATSAATVSNWKLRSLDLSGYPLGMSAYEHIRKLAASSPVAGLNFHLKVDFVSNQATKKILTRSVRRGGCPKGVEDGCQSPACRAGHPQSLEGMTIPGGTFGSPRPPLPRPLLPCGPESHLILTSAVLSPQNGPLHLEVESHDQADKDRK